MPRTDIEEMVLRMSADMTKMQRTFDKAIGAGDATARKIEKRFKDMNRGLEASFGKMGGVLQGAFAALSAGTIARTIQQTIKSIADIGDAADKLGVTTDEFQKLAFAAQLAGVETDTFINGMKKLAINSSDAANGQGELGKIFEANSVKIKDANGNLLSQTQILGVVADLVRNAASEQDRAAIAQAAFGKSGVDLLNLLAGGAAEVERAMTQAANANVTLTEEQIRKAQEFDDQLDTLIETITVGLKGGFIDFAQTSISEFDALIGKAQEFGTFMSGLVDWLQTHDILGNVIEDPRNRINAQLQALQQAKTALADGGAVQEGKGSLPNNIDAGSSQLRRPTRLPAPPSPVARRPSSPRSVASRPSRDSGPNDFERTAAQMKEETAALLAQKQAMDANLSTIDGYDAAIERAKVSQQLLADAQRAGLKITPELKANIDQLASGYVAMQTAVDQAREKHEAFIQSVDDMKALSKDVLRGFIDDLVAGKSATDALLGGLEKIADKLLDMAINSLVEGAFGALLGGGGGGGGLLSGLFGFAKGGVMTSRGPMPLRAYARGGVANSPQVALFGEGRKPEAFVPLPDGRSIPVSMKGGMASKTVLQQTINISGTGDAQIMANVRKAIEFGNRQLIAKMPKIQLEHSLRAE